MTEKIHKLSHPRPPTKMLHQQWMAVCFVAILLFFIIFMVVALIMVKWMPRKKTLKNRVKFAHSADVVPISDSNPNPNPNLSFPPPRYPVVSSVPNIIYKTTVNFARKPKPKPIQKPRSPLKITIEPPSPPSMSQTNQAAQTTQLEVLELQQNKEEMRDLIIVQGAKTLRNSEWRMKKNEPDLEKLLKYEFPEGILLGEQAIPDAHRTQKTFSLFRKSKTVVIKSTTDVYQRLTDKAMCQDEDRLIAELLSLVLNVAREKQNHKGVDQNTYWPIATYKLRNLTGDLATFNHCSVQEVILAAHAKIAGCGCPKLISLPLCSASALVLVKLLEYINNNYCTGPTGKPIDLGFLVTPLTVVAAAASVLI